MNPSLPTAIDLISSPAIDVMEPAENPFPINSLPPILRGAVDELVSVFQIPPNLPGACALATVSAALGKSLYLKHPVYNATPPNIYVLGVAASGQFKTSVFQHLCEPLGQVEAELFEKYLREKLPALKSREAMLKARIARLTRTNTKSVDDSQVVIDLNKLQCELAEVNAKMLEPRLLIEDATTEAIARNLPNGKGVLSFFSDDGRKLVANICGRYQKGRDQTDEQIYLKGYSVSDLRVSRVGTGSLHIREACLSGLVLIQPDKFNELAGNEALFDGGFLPRFLFVESDSEPRPWTPDQRALNPKAFEPYAARIRELLETYRLSDQPRRYIECEPDAVWAIQWFHGHCLHLRKQHLSKFHPFIDRWAENCCRLAIILHAATYGRNAHEHRLSKDTAGAAMQLSFWFNSQQLNLLHGARDSHEQKLKEKMAALLARKGPMTIRDICQHRIAANKEEAERILHSLQQGALVGRVGVDGPWALLPGLQPSLL